LNEKSSWTDYPEKYKFMSMEFEVNSDTRITDRATYSAIDLFGDLGGVIELCKMAVGFFAVRFS
jgi:hypothetical protein